VLFSSLFWGLFYQCLYSLNPWITCFVCALIYFKSELRVRKFKYQQAKYGTFLVWQCKMLYDASVCTLSVETQAKHLVPPQCKYCILIYKEIMVIAYSCFTTSLCNYTVSIILSCLVQRLRIVLSLRLS